MIRVLVTAPARQEPKIFHEYREGIANLILPDDVTVDTFYVINDCPELIPELYPQDKYIIHNTGEFFQRIHNDHIWTMSNMERMETLRNLTIQYALDNGYDYWFSIDTDVVLHPLTLKTLLEADKDIVSEIFWSTSKDIHTWCNAWMYDQGSGMLPEWHTPGLYQCGMTGACTLVKRKVLTAGVNYSHIPNIQKALFGEDRHFCVRAAVHGFELWVDTHHPARHLYTEAEYIRYMNDKQNGTLWT